MFGLRPEDINYIQSIIGKFSEVEKAVIFGSRAKGNYKKGSDVDIALYGNDLDQISSKIHDLLEEETLMPYFFDIIDYASLSNAALKEHIDRVGKVIFERAKAF